MRSHETRSLPETMITVTNEFVLTVPEMGAERKRPFSRKKVSCDRAISIFARILRKIERVSEKDRGREGKKEGMNALSDKRVRRERSGSIKMSTGDIS